jgi:predicted transcriptional regulator of viral defense system
MRTVDSLRVLAELSASQWGLFTAAQARLFGVPRLDVARLAEAGHLERLAHGVYKAVGAPGDEFEQLRAVWLSTDPTRLASDRLGDAENAVVVSGPAAAWLHGVGDLRPEPYEFTTARRRQSQRSELHYRVRALASGQTEIVQGLPATTLERTISDLLEARTDLSLMRQIIADAVRRRELDMDELARQLGPVSAAYGFARNDGAALLEHLLSSAGMDLDSRAKALLGTPLGHAVVEEYLAGRSSEGERQE